MSIKFRKFLGAALFGASFFCATPSMAVVALTCNNISGNDVTVTECSNGREGSYSLANNSDSPISQFFVSTKASESNRSTSTNRNDEGIYWSSAYISKDAWGEKPYGSFDSLFGLEDTGVFHYFADGGENPNLIAVGENTGKQFFFGAPTASEFIAINEIGRIIARSFINAPVSDVPEPGSLALLGLGMAGLAVVRRKRQAK